MDNELEEYLKNRFNLENLTSMLILYKLTQKGIDLTPQQVNSLNDQVSQQISRTEEDDESINFELDIEHVVDNLEIEITDEDYEDLQHLIDQDIHQVIMQTTSENSERVFRDWKKRSAHVLRKHKKRQQLFNSRLWSVWGTSVSLLELYLEKSLELGTDFNRKNRTKASQDNDMVFDVLVRLHARGCQISREIVVLLLNGLADGAMARWRTLHEITIVANFIKEHGQEVAEKYILHRDIEIYKAARQYQNHCEKLGQIPLTEEELKELQKNYDFLLQKFGNDFKNDYGWASAVLRKSNPTFADIERDVELEHMRPFFKMASANVHASAKGLFDSLGLLPTLDTKIMLAGPSIYGIAEPGQKCTFSLGLLTVTLLLLEVNLQGLAYARALQKLSNEIQVAFFNANQHVANWEEQAQG